LSFAGPSVAERARMTAWRIKQDHAATDGPCWTVRRVVRRPDAQRTHAKRGAAAGIANRAADGRARVIMDLSDPRAGGGHVGADLLSSRFA